MIMDENDLVACICEGPTEEWILDILLRENKLFFSRENLLDDKIFTGSKYRNPDNFIQQYLGMDYGKSKIIVLVIQDSHNKSYAIKAPYSNKIKGPYLIVTAPEIEMLMIHSLNLYDNFQKVKSKTKPSDFVADQLNMKVRNIKKEKFINKFFCTHSLTDAIKKHSEKCPKVKREKLLSDMLKTSN